jgi:cyclopropane fatty-acyl-phospholipid synthase-like methyltransferase
MILKKMNNDLQQSVVASMDGKEIEIFPFLPYLLQDLWEIGTSPELITSLLQKNDILNSKSNVLDLGCGKGVISVNLAKEFGCKVDGIDAIPEFINEAKRWAIKYQVDKLSNFWQGDIRKEIYQLRNYDLIVLGSIGPVLGNVETTLKKVKVCLNNQGMVLLDDGYIKRDSLYENPVYLNEEEFWKQIQNSEMKVIDQTIIDTNYIEESDTEIFHHIKIRAEELIHKNPEKTALFENYLKAQSEENEVLENHIICGTWLIQKI